VEVAALAAVITQALKEAMADQESLLLEYTP
jgi:hypothetical protein